MTANAEIQRIKKKRERETHVITLSPGKWDRLKSIAKREKMHVVYLVEHALDNLLEAIEKAEVQGEEAQEPCQTAGQ